MKEYAQDRESLRQQLGTDYLQGLSPQEVTTRQQQYGENKLKAGKKKTNLTRFFEQFKDAMILILLAAAAVSFVLAVREQDTSAFFEPGLILLIVVLNAVMGVVQESRAEKALEALQNMSAPHARVLRGGTEAVIDAALLVPGDIVKIEAGDFIPADARLLEAANLKTEESALTGESVPAEKDADAEVPEGAPLGDRQNMVYSGCSVTYGRGSAVVVSTGMHTEMGKIAGMLSGEKDTQTPLQIRLAKLGKMLGVMALAICAVIFVMGLIDGIPIVEIFMTAVSLAVSAIPEGLPAIVTIVLSLGVTRMAKRNAIIRSLPAVETLGSASVICSDKTGTLTQNRMTLTKAYRVDGDLLEDVGEANSEAIRSVIRLGALCCDGNVVIEDGVEKHLGDPTETSIVLAAMRNGMPKDELSRTFPRVAELPFDSDRKLMTVVCEMDGRYTVITKGAYDQILSRCTGGDTPEVKKLVDELGSMALRVLAVAVKEIDHLPDKASLETLESGLTLYGLVCMIDPPRPEAREAVKLCRQAGIKPVMITGDHVVTASAIAKDLGIQLEDDDAITGEMLAAMSEEQLQERVNHIAVYARVSPEDKIRIVKAWQKQGAIVSMTGDGVNDAPALKAADIGCAMGITGTDVAKGASDMTLMDDNFATIVQAVKEGRGIYDNIKKAVAFLLGTNIGEVLVVFFAMLIWKRSPLLSMQLLWINLVTDSLPAIALGVEPVDDEVMLRKPKPKDESIFAHGLGLRIALQGCMFAALTLTAFWMGDRYTGRLTGARTMAFMVLAFMQIIHAYNMRSGHSLFKIGVFTNKYLNAAAAISIALMLLVLLVPPIAYAFGLMLLPAWMYAAGLGMALVPVLVLEILKAVGIIRQ